MEIGLLCGTFNPIHKGHWLIASYAQEQFGLDKVLFITSPNPPHRDDELLDPKARFEMVEAALLGSNQFEASDIELLREGPSYTIDTVEELEKNYSSDTRFNLILGEDNLLQLDSWHRAKDIAKKCRILVAPRAAQAPHSVHTPQEHLVELSAEAKEMQAKLPGLVVEPINFAGIHLSSTQVRENIKLGLPVETFLPEAVALIVTQRGYYK
ncbi:MAG: nicotinate (nicotinamide) nucleotide adenylyltransferase [Candidatus Melainabacteria bacterium]|nr:MAG: nicotinate (nicotinamide) nucleotide adenylyltransferase [Candidatus Melainabacteria bacterium]